MFNIVGALFNEESEARQARETLRNAEKKD